MLDFAAAAAGAQPSLQCVEGDHRGETGPHCVAETGRREDVQPDARRELVRFVDLYDRFRPFLKPFSTVFAAEFGLC